MTILQAILTITPRPLVDVDTFSKTIEKNGKNYQVDNSKRLQAFLAQVAQETDGFNSFEEYASGAAYEGRADLGNTQPGDGIRFKGRGGLMITGRSNYKTVSHALFGDDRLLSQPEILSQPKYAAMASLYYWKTHNLGPLADAGNFEAITKAINGGLNGWATRLSYYQKLEMYVINLSPAKKVIVAAVAAAMIGLGIFVYLKARK
jgi:putative chitinase